VIGWLFIRMISCSPWYIALLSIILRKC